MGDLHTSNDQIDTTTVRLGEFEADLVSSAGPRILSYRLANRPTPFASLGDIAIDHPDAGRFRFLGGHRLWRAPEVPAITYEPDDRAVAIEKVTGGYEIIAHRDRHDVKKRLVITQSGDYTIVDHVDRLPEKLPTLFASLTS